MTTCLRSTPGRPLLGPLAAVLIVWTAPPLRAQSAEPAVAAPAGAPSPSPSPSEPVGEPAPDSPSPSDSDADPATLETAKRHFRQGLAFAQAGDCRAAVAELELAYELVPRPNALYNIAQCQERLFRYDLAVKYYERYLREAPAEAEDRAAVTAALGSLRNLLGTVHVESNVPAEVWVDDRLAGAAPGDVLVPSGGHTLELRAEGYLPSRSEVRLTGGQRIELRLTLTKGQTTVQVTETTGIEPTFVWIGAGATVVTAAIGGYFALQVSSLHGDAEKLAPVDPRRTEERKKIEDAELTADIFFASAALLAVGTTVLAFVTDWDGKQERPALEVAPSASAGGVGVVIGGRL